MSESKFHNTELEGIRADLGEAIHSALIDDSERTLEDFRRFRDLQYDGIVASARFDLLANDLADAIFSAIIAAATKKDTKS